VLPPGIGLWVPLREAHWLWVRRVRRTLYFWLNPWKEELDCGTTDLANVLVRNGKDLISSSWILRCLVVIEAHKVGSSDTNCHTPN
jgi:hypothetical protein